MKSEVSLRNQSNHPQVDPLLKVEEAAKILNVAVITLSVWRSAKRGGPSYVKLGSAVRYPLSAINKYITRNTIDVEEQSND